MNAVGLIARREVVTRLQQRGYRIGFGIALVIVVLACVVPSFFSGGGSGTQTYDIGVAADVPGLDSALQAVGDAQHVRVRMFATDAGRARAEVRAGDWDAALLPGGTVLAKDRSGNAVAVVQASYQLAATVARLERSGLTAAQITRALDVAPLKVQATSSSGNAERKTIAIIAVVLLFSQLLTFCTWVAMGVVEEKSSRVVELVLSAVRPRQLLTGKMLGIGLLAAGQVLTLGVVALVASSLSGTLTLPASAIATVAVSFVGFVLGFAFFGSLAAGLAATVSRQEEVSGVLAPVSLGTTVCYGLAFTTATSPDSAVAKVLSVVPPVSALAMPARIANGGVSALEIVLAVVLLLVTSAGIVAVAARVYRASVLHSGTRVKLRRAWRGEPVGELS